MAWWGKQGDSGGAAWVIDVKRLERSWARHDMEGFRRRQSATKWSEVTANTPHDSQPIPFSSATVITFATLSRGDRLLPADLSGQPIGPRHPDSLPRRIRRLTRRPRRSWHRAMRRRSTSAAGARAHRQREAAGMRRVPRPAGTRAAEGYQASAGGAGPKCLNLHQGHSRHWQVHHCRRRQCPRRRTLHGPCCRRHQVVCCQGNRRRGKLNPQAERLAAVTAGKPASRATTQGEVQAAAVCPPSAEHWLRWQGVAAESTAARRGWKRRNGDEDKGGCGGWRGTK